MGMPGEQHEKTAVDRLACKAMTYCEVKSTTQHDLRGDKMGNMDRSGSVNMHLTRGLQLLLYRYYWEE